MTIIAASGALPAVIELSGDRSTSWRSPTWMAGRQAHRYPNDGVFGGSSSAVMCIRLPEYWSEP